jgi:hypothetical protein
VDITKPDVIGAIGNNLVPNGLGPLDVENTLGDSGGATHAGSPTTQRTAFTHVLLLRISLSTSTLLAVHTWEHSRVKQKPISNQSSWIEGLEYHG